MKRQFAADLRRQQSYPKPSVDEIEDGLYLCGLAEVRNLELMRNLNIKYVLSVINDDIEIDKTSETITYKKIRAIDCEFEDLLTHFPETNQFIREAKNSGKNVIVHCMAGVSRSAAIIIAYLMNKNMMSYESALEMVIRARSMVCPNEGFEEQLILYQEMGFTLNGNNRQLRQHLIRTVLNSDKTWKKVNRVKEYFDRRDLVEGMTDNLNLGQKCVCVGCGQHLFNEIHMIYKNGIKVQKKACDWTYIEPQKWMTQLTQPFALISENPVKCANCGQNVIEFNKHFVHYLCDCCQHSGLPLKSLCFRISNGKFKIE